MVDSDTLVRYITDKYEGERRTSERLKNMLSVVPSLVVFADYKVAHSLLHLLENRIVSLPFFRQFALFLVRPASAFFLHRGSCDQRRAVTFFSSR